MIGGIIGFFLGAFFGIGLMCCFSIASAEDDVLEKLHNRNKSDGD